MPTCTRQAARHVLSCWEQSRVATHLHHDDSKGDGEASDTTHEGPRSYEGKSPGVHPSPGARG